MFSSQLCRCLATHVQATLADVSWDLSEAGKEKLAELAESVEFESEDSFRNKLNILKESFVSEEAAPAAATGEYHCRGSRSSCCTNS